MSRRAAFWWMVLASTALRGQSVDLPQSGFVYEPATGAFRPLNGVAGGAWLGNPIPLRDGVRGAAVCSPGGFALAALGDTGALRLIRFTGSLRGPLPAGVIESPDVTALSAGCSAAALYSIAAHRIQVLTGLPDTPALVADFQVALPGAVSALAIDDSGSAIAAAVAGNGVYSVSASTNPVLLTTLAGGAALAMGASRLFAADTQGNRLLEISLASGTPSVSVLADATAGISAPSAVSFDAKRQALLAGNWGSRNIVAVMLAGGAVSFLQCECQAGLGPLAPSLYAINVLTQGQPLLVLDSGSPVMKVYFVATR